MMKKTIVLVMLFVILLNGFAFANTQTSCFNETVLLRNISQTLNVGNVPTQLSLVEKINCPYGCSTTINDCKDNPNEQIMSVMGILGVFLILIILSAWIATQSSYIDYIILIIIATLSLMIGSFDVFTGGYRTLFIVFSLVPTLMIIYNFIERRREE